MIGESCKLSEDSVEFYNLKKPLNLPQNLLENSTFQIFICHSKFPATNHTSQQLTFRFHSAIIVGTLIDVICCAKTYPSTKLNCCLPLKTTHVHICRKQLCDMNICDEPNLRWNHKLHSFEASPKAVRLIIVNA
jgi:hypothetical protein